jgi:hypothetical protein
MTTFRFNWLAAAVALAAPVSLAAQEQEYTIHGTDIRVRLHVQMTAGDLFDRCIFDPAAPPPDAFICAGYLTGAEDAMAIVWAANGLERAYCKPEATQRGALLRTFIDYMRAHPEKRGLPAALVILQAFRDAFPCPPAPTQ